MKLTRERFIEIYNRVTQHSMTPDPIVEAVANECILGVNVPAKDDADVIDRLECIISDMHELHDALHREIA